MKHAGRDVNVQEFLIVQSEGYGLTEGRRTRPGIDNDVVHRPPRASDKLRLTPPRPAMQSTDDAKLGSGLGVLYERCRLYSACTCDVSVKCSGEEPAIVMIWRGGKHQDACEGSRTNIHHSMVSWRIRRAVRWST